MKKNKPKYRIKTGTTGVFITTKVQMKKWHGWMTIKEYPTISMFELMYNIGMERDLGIRKAAEKLLEGLERENYKN